MLKKYKLTLVALSAIAVFGCKKAADAADGASTAALDTQEVSQQVGDSMASIDESNAGGGSVAIMKGAEKTFARLAPKELGPSKLSLLLPTATAASCASTLTGIGSGQFGACVAVNANNSTVTQAFGGCTVGAATFTGSVTYNWSESGHNDCALHSIGDVILRVPNYDVTGLRSASLHVGQDASGVFGQEVLWAGGAGANKVFHFYSDGIQRKFTVSGVTIFDFTTKNPDVAHSLIITGTARSGRVISAGTLRSTDNVSGKSCDFTVNASDHITWDASGCNCPSSGTWDVSCSDSTTAALAITGCGTATYTPTTGTATNIVFDRCF